MHNFFDFTLSDLEAAIGALGNEKFRARQLYKWVYNKGVTDFEGMSNVPKGLRLLFKEMFNVNPLSVREVVESQDGSLKFAFSTVDGYVIESVFMPDGERSTLCLSSQVGCRMGCRFCVTAKVGFRRNLSSAEIMGQIVAVKSHVGADRINNIVFMGMGEPIDNLDSVLRSLEIMKDPLGLDLSHRRITVSSVGLLEGLRTLEPKVANIAISLNAADDRKRAYLMPVARLYPVREIINFVRGFKGTKRTRITFEYVLLRGVNDSSEDARLLSDTLAGVKCKINLIPFNESPYIEFKTPDERTVEKFQQHLLDRHFTAIVRDSRGKDVHGGCGQLGLKYLEEKENGRVTDI
jgi:23S rRNA (adenine2503-C2)-methyltransferase